MGTGTFPVILGGSIRGALLTVIAAASYFALISAEKMIVYSIGRVEGSLIRPVGIGGVVVISAGATAAFLRFLIRLLRLFAIAGGLWIYCVLVLGLFPVSLPWSEALARLGIDSAVLCRRVLAGLAPRLAAAAVLLSFAAWVNRFFRGFFGEIERGKIRFESIPPEYTGSVSLMIRLGVLFFSGALVIPLLPVIDTTVFVWFMGFLGLILALGSGAVFSGIFSRIFFVYIRPFCIGDRIEIEGNTGVVVGTTFLTTSLRTEKNAHVTVPNAQILNHRVVNYSDAARDPGLILHTTIGIPCNVPRRTACEILVSAARETPGVLERPEPFVLVNRAGGPSIAYELNGYVGSSEGLELTYSALHENIRDAFDGAGIEIMASRFSSIRDGGVFAIPSSDPHDGPEPHSFRGEKVSSATGAESPDGHPKSAPNSLPEI